MTGPRPLSISLFLGKNDTAPRPRAVTWPEFCAWLGEPDVRADKDGALFAPALFEPARRANVNVRELSMLVLDHDHDVDWPGDLDPWRELGIEFAAYSTFSHELDSPRFRFVAPLVAPVTPADYPDLWAWADQLSGGKIDRSCKDVSRMYYLPAHRPGAEYVIEIVSGYWLDAAAACAEGRARRQKEKDRGPHRGPWVATRSVFDIRNHASRIEDYHVTSRGWAYGRCPSHGGRGDTSLFIELKTGRYGCFAKCSPAAIRAALGVPPRPRRTWGPPAVDIFGPSGHGGES